MPATCRTGLATATASTRRRACSSRRRIRTTSTAAPPCDADELQLGTGADERRVVYTQFSEPGNRRLFTYPATNAQKYDLWNGFGLTYIVGDAASEAAADDRANDDDRHHAAREGGHRLGSRSRQPGRLRGRAAHLPDGRHLPRRPAGDQRSRRNFSYYIGDPYLNKTLCAADPDPDRFAAGLLQVVRRPARLPADAAGRRRQRRPAARLRRRHLPRARIDDGRVPAAGQGPRQRRHLRGRRVEQRRRRLRPQRRRRALRGALQRRRRLRERELPRVRLLRRAELHRRRGLRQQSLPLERLLFGRQRRDRRRLRQRHRAGDLLLHAARDAPTVRGMAKGAIATATSGVSTAARGSTTSSSTRRRPRAVGVTCEDREWRSVRDRRLSRGRARATTPSTSRSPTPQQRQRAAAGPPATCPPASTAAATATTAPTRPCSGSSRTAERSRSAASSTVDLQLDEDLNGERDLANSWSRPTTGRIRVCTGACTRRRDRGPLRRHLRRRRWATIRAPGAGNYIYMVDIETGKMIYKKPVIGSSRPTSRRSTRTATRTSTGSTSAPPPASSTR